MAPEFGIMKAIRLEIDKKWAQDSTDENKLFFCNSNFHPCKSAYGILSVPPFSVLFFQETRGQ